MPAVRHPGGAGAAVAAGRTRGLRLAPSAAVVADPGQRAAGVHGAGHAELHGRIRPASQSPVPGISDLSRRSRDDAAARPSAGRGDRSCRCDRAVLGIASRLAALGRQQPARRSRSRMAVAAAVGVPGAAAGGAGRAFQPGSSALESGTGGVLDRPDHQCLAAEFAVHRRLCRAAAGDPQRNLARLR
ncbi:hypothetical protein D3C72_1406680 [compost metagenome]